MNSTYGSTFPNGPRRRDIWIVCEARRRGTVEHLHQYIAYRCANPTIEAGPGQSATSAEETQLMSGVPATGKRDYVRMVKHDLLKTDLVMLRDILENMAAMHKTLFNSTHLLAWTFCLLLPLVDLPSKLQWLKGVFNMFLIISGIYWACYIPSWSCVQKCTGVVNRLEGALDADSLCEDDNDALNGWHWGGLGWCPRFW